MDDATKAEINDDIQAMFARMTPEDQKAYVDFQEALAALTPGSVLEFNGATFFKDPDGSLNAVLPKRVVDAYNERFPTSPLEAKDLPNAR